MNESEAIEAKARHVRIVYEVLAFQHQWINGFQFLRTDRTGATLDSHHIGFGDIVLGLVNAIDN